MTTFTSEDRKMAETYTPEEIIDELINTPFESTRFYAADMIKRLVQQKVQLNHEIKILKKCLFSIQTASIDLTKKCGDSYDSVCPPSICDCQGMGQEK